MAAREHIADSGQPESSCQPVPSRRNPPVLALSEDLPRRKGNCLQGKHAAGVPDPQIDGESNLWPLPKIQPFQRERAPSKASAGTLRGGLKSRHIRCRSAGFLDCEAASLGPAVTGQAPGAGGHSLLRRQEVPMPALEQRCLGHGSPADHLLPAEAQQRDGIESGAVGPCQGLTRCNSDDRSLHGLAQDAGAEGGAMADAQSSVGVEGSEAFQPPWPRSRTGGPQVTPHAGGTHSLRVVMAASPPPPQDCCNSSRSRSPSPMRRSQGGSRVVRVPRTAVLQHPQLDAAAKPALPLQVAEWRQEEGSQGQGKDATMASWREAEKQTQLLPNCAADWGASLLSQDSLIAGSISAARSCAGDISAAGRLLPWGLLPVVGSSMPALGLEDPDAEATSWDAHSGRSSFDFGGGQSLATLQASVLLPPSKQVSGSSAGDMSEGKDNVVTAPALGEPSRHATEGLHMTTPLEALDVNRPGEAAAPRGLSSPKTGASPARSCRKKTASPPPTKRRQQQHRRSRSVTSDSEGEFVGWSPLSQKVPCSHTGGHGQDGVPRVSPRRAALVREAHVLAGGKTLGTLQSPPPMDLGSKLRQADTEEQASAGLALLAATSCVEGDACGRAGMVGRSPGERGGGDAGSMYAQSTRVAVLGRMSTQEESALSLWVNAEPELPLATTAGISDDEGLARRRHSRSSRSGLGRGLFASRRGSPTTSGHQPSGPEALKLGMTTVGSSVRRGHVSRVMSADFAPPLDVPSIDRLRPSLRPGLLVVDGNLCVTTPVDQECNPQADDGAAKLPLLNKVDDYPISKTGREAKHGVPDKSCVEEAEPEFLTCMPLWRGSNAANLQKAQDKLSPAFADFFKLGPKKKVLGHQPVEKQPAHKMCRGCLSSDWIPRSSTAPELDNLPCVHSGQGVFTPPKLCSTRKGSSSRMPSPKPPRPVVPA